MSRPRPQAPRPLPARAPEPNARAPLEGLEETIATPRVGWVCGVGGPAGVLVDFPGNARGPLPARTTVPLDGRAVLEAVAARQGVVLLFDQGDPALPLIVGLVQPAGSSPLVDLLLETPADGAPPEAELDGHRVALEAQDELVLRCGEASITLRRNGKVVIRGVQVETHATGTNRIKGGSVRIN